MHNVVAGNPGFAWVDLELSNTLYSVGRLSFPKPPHSKAATLLHSAVTDGPPALEPGNGVIEDPFRDPSYHRFLPFRPNALFLGPDYCCSHNNII